MTTPPIWSIVAAVGLAVVMVQQVRVIEAQKELADYKAQITQAALDAERAARKAEADLVKKMDEVRNEAKKQAEQAAADAAAADVAADGLRAQVAKLLASRTSCPAATSQRSDATGELLAQVLSEMERAGAEMARAADANGIAGAACQSFYKK